MTIPLHDGTNHNGLFDIVGKAMKVQKDINTSRGTTIPTDINALITYFNGITPVASVVNTLQPVTQMPAGYQSGASGTVSSLQAFIQAFTIAFINNSAIQADNSLKTALQAIITQMLGSADSFNVSAVTVAATAGGGNTGTGKLIVSKKRGDGLVQENILAETLAGTFQASGLTASLTLAGQQAATSPLGQDWPIGSGSSASISSVDANTGSILTNGGMENFTASAFVPDNWIAAVATPGTTLLPTVIEVQTITITGTPTAGTYTVSWVNAASKTQTTTPLVYNATSSILQSALRLLTGLEQVTVVSSGTTPNYTHTITFNGRGGNVAQVTIADNTTGGSHTFTPATVTAGTAQVFTGGTALKFASNGSELTEIRQILPQAQLSPDTGYAISLWVITDAIPAAGVIKVDLYDGGAIINDAQGVANTITFNANAMLTTWQHLSVIQVSECTFRLPAVLPPVVYLRIRISTAITNAKNMFIDQVALTPLTQLYAGGPFAALFTGDVAWASSDVFTVTTTNDRAGVLREWMERDMGLSSLSLLFPTSGSPTIPDSVVS